VSWERRRSKRYQADREIALLRKGAEIVGHTEDLGRGGAKIRIHVVPPLELGERLMVAFPGIGHEHAEAEVRWVDPTDRSRVGLRFLSGFRPSVSFRSRA
jgi:hypothetical protein